MVRSAYPAGAATAVLPIRADRAPAAAQAAAQAPATPATAATPAHLTTPGAGARFATSGRRAAAALLTLALFTEVAGPPAHSARADGALAVTEIAPDVFVVGGRPADPDPSNQGRTGNVAFVVGPAGVLVWNSGTSRRHGEAIAAAIRERTDRPIRTVVLAQAAQDLVFGATALRDQGARILMHRDAAATMRTRCGGCLAELHRLLGDEAMARTELPPVDERLDGDRTLAVIGRDLRLLDLGSAAAPGSVALYDPASGVLFSGGMVMVRQVVETRDADPAGWQRALERLSALAPEIVVPDHGPVGTVGDIAASGRYLAALEARVGQLVRDGVSLADASARGQLPAFASWSRYEPVHGHNVHHAYLRLERSLFTQ
jgi:glyoxylase-like metal-dependent hydrolase (beta-lactamase superfamily II)